MRDARLCFKPVVRTRRGQWAEPGDYQRMWVSSASEQAAGEARCARSHTPITPVGERRRFDAHCCRLSVWPFVLGSNAEQYVTISVQFRAYCVVLHQQIPIRTLRALEAGEPVAAARQRCRDNGCTISADTTSAASCEISSLPLQAPVCPSAPPLQPLTRTALVATGSASGMHPQTSASQQAGMGSGWKFAD